MRIDETSLVSIKPELAELLKELKPGDAIKGRVLEAAGGSIAIRAASGQVFTAILQEGSRIPKGAFIELIVSNIADGKVFAELKTDSRASGMDEKLSQLLKQFGLPVDEKNTEALKLLIKYKLPVSKETITNITGLQKSADNLNQNTEGRAGLLLSGLDIKNTPVDVLNRVVLNYSTDLTSPEAEEAASVQAGGALADNNEAEGKVHDARQCASISPGRPAVGEGTDEAAGIRQNHAAVQNGADEAAVHKENMEYKERVTGRDGRATAKDDGVFLKDNEAAGMLKALNKLGIETGIEVRKFADKVADILASIKDTDMEAIAYLISKGMETTPKNLGLLLRNIRNSDSLSKHLEKLQQRIDAEHAPELRAIKESIRKLFLEPRQLEDSKEVSKQLKDMAVLGEKLESYLNSSGNKDTEIRNAISTLRDNLDFIISINEHINYLQVPVLINGDATTAKLYVFKEGSRSKAINQENATILVALDLKSLGHIESVIGVTGKTVNATFRVENKSIGALIEKQSNLLKNALGEKGFHLNAIRVIGMEQPFSLLSLEAMINEGSWDKIHFDMRV